MSTKLSNDGRGINGDDPYRSRIATFANNNMANAWGNLLTHAPELFDTLANARDAALRGDSAQALQILTSTETGKLVRDAA